MKVLAIDTALGAASACVFEQGRSSPIAGETLLMQRGHAEALLPLIDRVMARVEGGFASLHRVAVTVGPGSFTGIRVGIAAARAIGLACEIPVVGVSVLAALAAPLLGDESGEIVVAAVDARHDNVFFQAYAPGGQVLVQPRIAPIREALRAVAETKFRATGPGARAMASAASASGMTADVVGSLVAPEIAYVALLGAAAEPDLAPPRPMYLKAPDARPQAGGRIARA